MERRAVADAVPGREPGKHRVVKGVADWPARSSPNESELGAAEISFLLDSTVGLIGYEQNQSMKILSVAAVARCKSASALL